MKAYQVIKNIAYAKLGRRDLHALVESFDGIKMQMTLETTDQRGKVRRFRTNKHEHDA